MVTWQAGMLSVSYSYGSSLIFPSPVAMASVSVVSHLEFPELRELCVPASVKLTSGCFCKTGLGAVGCGAEAHIAAWLIAGGGTSPADTGFRIV